MTRARWRLAASGALVAVAAMLVAATLLLARRDAPATAPTALEQLGHHGAVPYFALIERSGRGITRDDLRGSIWVADFIYTECTESCPTQTLQLAQLQREFTAEPGFRLVSITVDPAHDTPEVLGRYAERHGAGDRWWFLTGDKREIHCLAREGFRLAVVDPRDAAPPECGGVSWLRPAAAWASHGSGALVMHSARVALVDRHARIRAYHLATDPASMAGLRANVRALLAERGAP